MSETRVRTHAVIRWSLQVLTTVVLTLSVPVALYAVYLPASAFGYAIQMETWDLRRAIEPGAIYAVSSLFIIGIPLLAATCRVKAAYLLLPGWAVPFVTGPVIIMFLLYGFLSFWSLLPETSGNWRVDLGYNSARYLAIFTTVVLGVGLVLVREGPPRRAWRSRHRTRILVIVPFVPAATAGVILGAAGLFSGS